MSVQTDHIGRHTSGSVRRTTIRRPTALLAWFARQAATRRARRERRKSFNTIRDHGPWIYDDLGITPDDVQWASNLPLHRDAGEELERLRARNALGR